MLTHYIDFDVIAGATAQDAALLHGRILSANHFASTGVHAYDFPNWQGDSFAGKVLRLFGEHHQLELLVTAINPLISAGAVTHSPILEVPSNAVLSDYAYIRVHPHKANSGSAKRRFLKRNPGKEWVTKKQAVESRLVGYRIPMLSQSNGQTYPLYIARMNEKCASGMNNGRRMSVPVFDKKKDTSKPIVAASNTSAARSDDGIKLCRDTDSFRASVMRHIDTVFGVDGFLVRDGGHYNPSQLQYAYAVAETFLSTRSDNAPPIGVIEAATGTGKTLGYLIPALLCAEKNNARVVVSTYTKQLQQQLYNEDTAKAARYIEELTGRIIRIDRRFGRRNYLSFAACAAYIDYIKDDTSAEHIKSFVIKVCKWAIKKGSALIVLNDYLDEHNLSNEDIPSGLDFSMLAIGALSSDAEVEAYKETIKETNKADLLIVNHALSVINARSWLNALESDGRKDIYVFDEADKLDEAARSIACANLSIRQTLKSISEGVENYSKSCAKTAAKNIRQVEASFEAALSSGTQVTPDIIASLKELVKGISKAVKKASQSITTGSDEFKERMNKADFVDASNDIAYAVRLIETGATGMVGASPVQRFPRLLIGYNAPAKVLSRLWSLYEQEDDGEVRSHTHSVGILFTSASITSRSGSFLSFVNTVGVNTSINKATGMSYHFGVTDQWLSLENDDFGSMTFILPDQRIPHPTTESFERSEDDEVTFELSPKWLEYAASMIVAAQKSGGRTLVLTNSYKASRALAKAVGEYDLIQIIEHQKGETISQHLPAFIAANNSVLITHGGWEGLNLPNTIQNIVIPRIPYAPPNTQMQKLREVTLESKGLTKEHSSGIAISESTDSVVRKLKQGIGRGIRTKTDKVVVWLGDPRIPLPPAYKISFDPVLMTFPRKQRKDLLGFVPKRFLANYNSAPLFINGALYEVAV